MGSVVFEFDVSLSCRCICMSCYDTLRMYASQTPFSSSVIPTLMILSQNDASLVNVLSSRIQSSWNELPFFIFRLLPSRAHCNDCRDDFCVQAEVCFALPRKIRRFFCRGIWLL